MALALSWTGYANTGGAAVPGRARRVALLLACLFQADGDGVAAQTAAPTPGPPGPTFAVFVPKDDFSLPAHLYVLPVILVPSDQLHLAESPSAPGKDLGGKPMNSTRLAEFRAGAQNLSVHLHMARRKYETMARNPLNGASRGTFRLSSWDHDNGRAGIVTSVNEIVRPLIVKSPAKVVAIAGAYGGKSYAFLGPVLNAAGCRQATCPFVFVVAIMGDPIDPAGGQRFNHGYNNGGGWLVLNFRDHLFKAGEAGSEVTLQSTLLHELGHAFGLPHIVDYCQIADGLTCLLRLSSEGSDSIMSYAKKNHIFGCGFVDKSLSNPAPWKGQCTYPGDAAVDAFPGALLPEDLRVLGMNRRAFPDLFFEPALDSAKNTVYGFDGPGNTVVAGHTTVELTSPDTLCGGTSPSVLIGADDNAFPQYFDAYDAVRMWHSRQVGNNGWVSLTVDLPAEARVTRLDVYSGFASGTHMSTGIRVRVGSVVAAQVLGSTANQTIVFDRMAKDFSVELRAGSSGQVVLRGIRVWAEVAGQTTEIYPAAEPRVTQASAGTFGGSLANIVGSTQWIGTYGKTYLPNLGWHSSKVTPGSWVSVTVEFPHEVQLGFVKAHTGHSGYYHAARQVQIERRCVCGSSAAGGCSSRNAACSAAGAGSSVFEFVKRVNASPDQLVSFEVSAGRIWKIAMRTPTSAEQSVTPGHLHVRGLRLFRSDGAEIFPARVVASGI